MKYSKLATVFLLAFVVAVPSAFAEIMPINLRPNDATPSIPVEGGKLRADYEARKLEIKAEMEAKRAEVKANVELRRSERASSTASSSRMKNASSSERRLEKQDEIAERHAERTAIRFTAMVERLMNMIERIESRIAKVKANGGVTAEAEVSVSAAKADLVKAQADIAILKNIEVSGDNFQEKFGQVKEAAAKVKADLRSAHTNMMKAIRSLGSAKAGINASSTASTTASTTQSN
jgi:hypothetical protein